MIGDEVRKEMEARREKSNPICENCDEEMRKVGTKTLGQFVAGQRAKTLKVYQCTDCKRIDIE